MEEEAKPVRQPQRRLNPHMQEKVNAVTRKDHFPLPFIDQVLRGSQPSILPFLDGYSSIFSDMVERIMEVLDDITDCPWHVISKKGIEVDKAKVELIVKLPSPTTVKGVRLKRSRANTMITELFSNFSREHFSRFGVPKVIINDGEQLTRPFLECLPYHLVYGQSMSPVEVQYKAWWAIKALNVDLNRANMKRFLDLNEMEELRNDAYNNSNIAKQRLKRWHDQSVYYPTSVFKWSSRATHSTGSFKVNGQCLKPFLELFSKDKEEINLLEPNQA
ncbi:hypothetical protein CK203_040296 [Vitis vinifera]|uniref:Uncharacterized protein n=1 Tax=Vitis vinifera TaxID=29760 RepID=A0A438HXL7_VITVI|nr:hypothetical protein CK203_040296 [Vitis vinifera]